jgi:hypothetical protein
LEIDVLLAGGIALRCGMESDFFAAGVLPGEEILEDRSAFWEQSDGSGAVAGVDDGNFSPEEGEPFPLPAGSLSLRPSAWPPLHAWVGALLLLLFENGLERGFLLRKELPPVEVHLSAKARKLINDLNSGRCRGRIGQDPACAACPFVQWCMPDGTYTREE